VTGDRTTLTMRCLSASRSKQESLALGNFLHELRGTGVRTGWGLVGITNWKRFAEKLDRYLAKQDH
jgi:hypothetical protein